MNAPNHIKHWFIIYIIIRYDGEFLLPEFRHLDFFWLLKGDAVSDELMIEMMDAIKSISGVQMVTELTHTKIKHREHLIF